jgi:hypothetical protein
MAKNLGKAAPGAGEKERAKTNRFAQTGFYRRNGAR